MAIWGLNHMTTPNSSTQEVFEMAKSLGFAGVELRNDLAAAMFDGHTPEAIRKSAKQSGLRIFALAEVYAFNDNSEPVIERVRDLLELAQKSGAEAVVLIPLVADSPVPRKEQRKLLRQSLHSLLPIFQDSEITALIEPLGFANSSLRFKVDVIKTLEELGNPDCFALIHDTFHHTLSGEEKIYPKATRIVHISGISNAAITIAQMQDKHRGFVARDDRLNNVDQISRLLAQGYDGPLSFEVFAPDAHALNDPTAHLSVSTAFITSQLSKLEACEA